ncbi:hypothetical protein OLMES_1132 [Oleiphilus messinensis]|uniref:Uncharacterized protein n=1 Tax=Oleiphilus messinensis TaxID=141451 RepID=A0A1Y0I415_9GAMM|nr:hypothetical protein [Oleiphilus messinensis]ARU55217.1 hypothetical protein OLMES_1132 [Oleiphilus messinensis]
MFNSIALQNLGKSLKYDVSSVTLLLITATLAFAPLPEHRLNYLIIPLMNLLHVPGAWLVYHFIASLLRRWRHTQHLYQSLSVLISLGMITAVELVQSQTGRIPSFEDLILGAFGITIGATWHHPGIGRQYKLIIFFVMFGLAFTPLAIHLHRWHELQSRLPILANFSAPYEQQLWEANKYEMLAVIKSNEKNNNTGQNQLSVQLNVSGWTGITFNNPGVNFENYSELCIEASGSAPARLHIRIDDQGAMDYSSRFHAYIDINTTPRDQCIGIAGLQSPNGRILQRDQIIRIVLFVAGNPTLEALVISKLELSR